MADSFLYDAFISYRHGGRDQEIAELLHRWLENYRTPAEVVRKGALPRLTRVFRDQDELQTSSDLSESITAALKQSRFLIVICSPRAKDSPWINQEIERFRTLGGGDRILPLLIDGTPETAFPRSLYVKERVGHRDTEGNEVWTERVVEPLAANICAPDLQGAKRLLKIELLRLLSPILGCGFDDLRGRHQERARRRLAAIAASMAALTLVFAGLAVYAFLQRNEAVTATGEAVAARLQAEKNEQRAEENEKRAVAETDRAEQALLQRSVQESNRVAALANELADQGKTRLPMALALQVAPREGARDKRPLTPSVNALLTRLVRSDRAISSTYVGEYVYSITATADEKWVFTGTTDGNVQFWQMPGLTFHRNIKAQDGLVGNMQVSPDQKSLLVTGTSTPTVWDIESATKRFGIKLPAGFSKIARYSPDGRFIVASSNKNKVFVASAQDGTIIKTIDGPEFEAAYENALTTADRLGMTSYAEDSINALMAQITFNMFGAMTDIAISPNGSMIAASGSADPESAIRLYSLPDGKLLRTLSGNQFVAFSSVMSLSQRLLFSPDGARLFAIAEGTMRSQIQAFDVASGRLVSTFLVPTVGANTLASDAKGSILLSGHIDGSIVLWCTADGRFVKAFRTHSDGVNSLITSRDGSLFVSTAGGGSVAL